METIKKYAKYIPLAVLTFMYAWQGIQALLGSDEQKAVIAVLGLSDSTATLLGYLVAPLDLAVAAILVFWPNSFIFIWAGLWTWVPRSLEYYGGLNVEFGESLIVTVAAVFAYLAFKRFSVRFLGK